MAVPDALLLLAVGRAHARIGRAAGDAGIGGEKYTLHGLRKAAGVRLAEAGASVPMIMSILGHRSPGMALFYCREANKRQLSDEAMKLWEKAA